MRMQWNNIFYSKNNNLPFTCSIHLRNQVAGGAIAIMLQAHSSVLCCKICIVKSSETLIP